MTRSPRRSDPRPRRHACSSCAAIALAWAALGGCSPAAEYPATAEADGGAPRRPDGVAIDPALELPEAQNKSDADKTLTTLRAPLGTDVALATVANLFRRIVREDVDALSPLFTREVHVITGSGPGAQQTSA